MSNTNNNSDAMETKDTVSAYTMMDDIGFIEKYMIETILHQQEIQQLLNEKKLLQTQEVQVQTQESMVDLGKALDDGLVATRSSGTESEVQDESSKSGNDTYTNDADIIPIYDEEPMVEVQLTVECNIFAIGQQHTEQPEFNNEGGVDQYIEQC
ncbi:hypothetical protein Tco_0077546 [Tanacetum coccineum]